VERFVATDAMWLPPGVLDGSLRPGPTPCRAVSPGWLGADSGGPDRSYRRSMIRLIIDFSATLEFGFDNRTQSNGMDPISTS
jgi:hypothetical protein